ncbi:hypothetical protein GRF29_8g2618833 [Pseudopithomyces chartarum]|uniref:HNH nuclease domain-containing protein n=1 Tax=Pseudopithomyces chartarum TaxID=1892770 RepID=A0AAN6M5L9_9PLEO|nr:hypothetical protein GRF29_8g2618833 [Pseudopithomyces chartarum]
MPFESLKARPKYDTPSHKDGGQSLPTNLDYKVYLRHPGYSDTGNILLALPALDHSQGGIHHETARIACAILANNRWDGFFAETKAGQPIQAGPDDILREKNYYFFVSHDVAEGEPLGLSHVRWFADMPISEKYAVVPSFSHWRFPHDDLPKFWMSCEPPKLPRDRPLPRQSSLTEATLTRDISCRITNHIEGTEHAHLVPRSEERWFSENGMFRYTNQQRPGTEPVDDAQNAILLRSDVHTIFDQKRFGVVPKSSALLVHIMAPGSSLELTRLYHNVPLQPLVGVAIQYILARFAWTIFAHSMNFIQQGLKRTLCIHVGDGEISTKDFSGEQCRQLFTPGSKSRSQSPRKRQRDTFVEPPGDGDEDGEYIRGRKRRRSFCSRSLDRSFDEKLRTTSQDTLSDSDTEIECDNSSTSEYTGGEMQPKVLVDLYRKYDADLESTTGA